MPSLATLPTLATASWNAAFQGVCDAVDGTSDSGLAALLDQAHSALAEHGPTRDWADLVCAVDVAALERARMSLSGYRRLVYIEVSDAVAVLLQAAERVHGVAPSDRYAARAESARSACYRRA